MIMFKASIPYKYIREVTVLKVNPKTIVIDDHGLDIKDDRVTQDHGYFSDFDSAKKYLVDAYISRVNEARQYMNDEKSGLALVEGIKKKLV